MVNRKRLGLGLLAIALPVLGLCLFSIDNSFYDTHLYLGIPILVTAYVSGIALIPCLAIGAWLISTAFWKKNARDMERSAQNAKVENKKTGLWFIFLPLAIWAAMTCIILIQIFSVFTTPDAGLGILFIPYFVLMILAGFMLTIPFMLVGIYFLRKTGRITHDRAKTI
ncbi:hypothetical protein IT087_01580 [Candidatus Uhrbacteria bacterium]|nr:hypothetical protein [Candidatus Uhrbacteria bacterium]